MNMFPLLTFGLIGPITSTLPPHIVNDQGDIILNSGTGDVNTKKKKKRSKAEITPPFFESAATQFFAADF
jgi:hypothetical protein